VIRSIDRKSRVTLEVHGQPPLPEGLEPFGKRQKEFAVSKGPSGAERAGASESLDGVRGKEHPDNLSLSAVAGIRASHGGGMCAGFRQHRVASYNALPATLSVFVHIPLPRVSVFAPHYASFPPS